MRLMNTRPLRATLAGAVVALGLTAADSARADLITNWLNITNNGNTNVGAQFQVNVTAVGGSQVNFRFSNAVGVASSITDIYFDDKSVASLAAPLVLAMSAGVDFSLGASPGNLPGGNAVSFTSTLGFNADSNPPTAPNGINGASEWLDITFNLAAGKTFADVIAQLGSGELVVGMHVQAISPQGGSDSYINGRPLTPPPGPTPIPAPAALGLFGLGLFGLGLALRRRA